MEGERKMVQAQLLAAWFGNGYLRAQRRLRGADSARGDVPGWVMVTVMTAAVVAVLLPFVRTELQGMLSAAFQSVRPG